MKCGKFEVLAGKMREKVNLATDDITCKVTCYTIHSQTLSVKTKNNK